VRAQSAIVRIVSIVESFAVHQLVAHIEPHFPAPRSDIVDDVYVEAEDRAIGTWPNIQTAYKRWLQISFTAAGNWAQMTSMHDARNAIAHGLGGLTRRQARKNIADLVQGLRAIDIDVHGTQLILSNRSVRAATVNGRDFVTWLDAELQRL
jgi:hypothetical protein